MNSQTCPYPDFAPSTTKVNLPDSQAGPGRHKCVDCAYHAGAVLAGMGTMEGLELEELTSCDHGNFAPLAVIENLHASQAGEGRHKCVVCSFAEGYNSDWAILGDEVVQPNRYKEGRTKEIAVVVYERNPKARKACIEHYGAKCKICGFDFEERYGEPGKGLIHVHHIVPLSQMEEEYELDPTNDLCPVCPNCHAIIHRRNPPYSTDEVKNMLK